MDVVAYLYAFADSSRGRHCVCGSFGRPAVVCSFVNTYMYMLPVHFNQSINQFISRHSTKARETPVPVSVVSGRSSMKLGTNIHHVSGHC